MKIDEIQAKIVSAGNLDEIVPRKLATILEDIYEKIENISQPIRNPNGLDKDITENNWEENYPIPQEFKEKELIEKYAIGMENDSNEYYVEYYRPIFINFLNEFKKLN